MDIKKVKSFWETCNTTFAHITAKEWLVSPEYMINSFKFKMGPIDPTGKTIIDYGIGGAYLGIYLFNNFNIKKYIGIDISQRSLDAANKNLLKYLNFELLLSPINFNTIKADVFVSFATIQHFPNKKYLDDFLSNLNNSNIKEIALQIRYAKTNEFNNKYKTQEDVMMGCCTNKKYIISILTKYDCILKGKVNKNSNYQYLYFKIK